MIKKGNSAKIKIIERKKGIKKWKGKKWMRFYDNKKRNKERCERLEIKKDNRNGETDKNYKHKEGE